VPNVTPIGATCCPYGAKTSKSACEKIKYWRVARRAMQPVTIHTTNRKQLQAHIQNETYFNLWFQFIYIQIFGGQKWALI